MGPFLLSREPAVTLYGPLIGHAHIYPAHQHLLYAEDWGNLVLSHLKASTTVDRRACLYTAAPETGGTSSSITAAEAHPVWEGESSEVRPSALALDLTYFSADTILSAHQKNRKVPILFCHQGKSH